MEIGETLVYFWLPNNQSKLIAFPYPFRFARFVLSVLFKVCPFGPDIHPATILAPYWHNIDTLLPSWERLRLPPTGPVLYLPLLIFPKKKIKKAFSPRRCLGGQAPANAHHSHYLTPFASSEQPLKPTLTFLHCQSTSPTQKRPENLGNSTPTAPFTRQPLRAVLCTFLLSTLTLSPQQNC